MISFLTSTKAVGIKDGSKKIEALLSELQAKGKKLLMKWSDRFNRIHPSQRKRQNFGELALQISRDRNGIFYQHATRCRLISETATPWKTPSFIPIARGLQRLKSPIWWKRCTVTSTHHKPFRIWPKWSLNRSLTIQSSSFGFLVRLPLSWRRLTRLWVETRW